MTNLVTRSDYFDAALRLLAEGGPGALKVGRLCRELGVTTGSFYHHFASIDGFIESLLAEWEASNAERFARLGDEATGPTDVLGWMRSSVYTLPHRSEAALRAWSHIDPKVAAAQARVDAARVATVQGLIQRVVGDAERAGRLALLGLVVLAGFQVGRDPDNPDELAELVDEYLTLLRPRPLEPAT